MSSVVMKTADGAKPENKKIKILLVDDTPENLISLEAALAPLGEELVLANSGTEALRYLLHDDFAAVLLDVKMPDMDGFETAELVRTRSRSRHTPILFLTAYKSDEHLFRGYDLGAVDFLFKPLIPEVLRSKVAVFVEVARKAEELRQHAAALQQQSEVLRKAEERFRSLLEAAPDSMVICRADGGIVLVNSRTEGLFGYSRHDLLGQNIRMLVPQWSYEFLPAPDEDLAGIVLRPMPDHGQLRAVAQDGAAFPVEISLSPLQTDQGLLITSAIRDITERVKIEDQRRKAEEKVRQLNAHLAELNASLEERVLERTEQLMRSNEELAQFAYVASHDLQEPLRTVSIYTELLQQRYGHLLPPEAAEFMAHITDNTQRMGQLVRALLDLSRVDSRGSEHFVRMSCGDALDTALKNLESRIEESGASITRDALPCLWADPVQIARVFQNLLVNGIQYRGAEPPRIHVSAQRQGEEWVFRVRDNGIGIDPQYHEKIFGVFRRLHGRDNPGTGMGLAICKKVVQRHGGRIWVESQLGEGATFYFALPCREDR